MPMCINCGSDKVERQGDAFTCHKCQFQWDVAFEQANKVYLRAQGRQPATSIFDAVAPSDADTLTETQGQDGAAIVTSGTAVDAPINEQETSGETAKLPDVPSNAPAAPSPDKPSGKKRDG